MERIGEAASRALTAYEELGPVQPSTCGDRPKPSSQPRVPAAVRTLISELGLRYRPSAQADLEEHAASLALLARDLADIPPRHLATAVNRWVRESVFMPKAADLVRLAREAQAAGKPRSGEPMSAQQLADLRNADLSEDARRKGLRWVADGDTLRLEQP